MAIDINTPALLFPAITLLLLAYTNRFLAIARLIRELHARLNRDNQEITQREIQNLRKRLKLIRGMQFYGVLSISCCVVTMFVLFFNLALVGKVFFIFSLSLMLVSLFLSLYEITISIDAINIELESMEHPEQQCSPST